MPPQANQPGPYVGLPPSPPRNVRWGRGDHLPPIYRQDRFRVTDWRRRNLPPPRPGYGWMCYEYGDCLMVHLLSGVVFDTWYLEDRQSLWDRRYSRTYRYDDDLYYRECRDRPDPAGILVGGIIGGLIGHAIEGDRRDSGAATVAGVIIGAMTGAALTRDLDCEDRDYAYVMFRDGLNGGRIGHPYVWFNPNNEHRGEFEIRRYYDDPDGFYCAEYRHRLEFGGRREATGRACRQPDGAWVFLR